jgi:aerobic-type carbon monoxide dehydrogenase small subunit (CoxS/CutS family)
MTIAFLVNNNSCRVEASRREEKLLDYLHDSLDLTGTKLCCGIAVCRACTVAMTKPPNRVPTPILACSTPLWLVDGAEIITIEGIAKGDTLSQIQEAFLREFAFQCGYCAPGFVVAAQILLTRFRASPPKQDKLDGEIETALGGHICRCTGYVRYFEAVRKTAQALIGGG